MATLQHSLSQDQPLTLPFADPRRRRSSFRPLQAWRHFRRLIADKEDTEQVFRIIDCLRGPRFRRDARAFWNGALGRRLLAHPENLPALLDDHAALRALPGNSVAAAYVDFMEREGLTAAGLVAEYDKFRGNDVRYHDLVELYANRLRDIHDLFHVLTGYGRDALGEQCVLAFTHRQNPNLGTWFIAWAGAREVGRVVPPATPIYSAVSEAARLGRAARRIVDEDIAALLAEPLDAARARLGIGEPTLYQEAHRAYRSRGIDPYNFLASKAAMA